jgi:hypothetical protein
LSGIKKRLDFRETYVEVACGKQRMIVESRMRGRKYQDAKMQWTGEKWKGHRIFT